MKRSLLLTIVGVAVAVGYGFTPNTTIAAPVVPDQVPVAEQEFDRPANDGFDLAPAEQEARNVTIFGLAKNQLSSGTISEVRDAAYQYRAASTFNEQFLRGRPVPLEAYKVYGYEAESKIPDPAKRYYTFVDIDNTHTFAGHGRSFAYNGSDSGQYFVIFAGSSGDVASPESNTIFTFIEAAGLRALQEELDRHRVIDPLLGIQEISLNGAALHAMESRFVTPEEEQGEPLATPDEKALHRLRRFGDGNEISQVRLGRWK